MELVPVSAGTIAPARPTRKSAPDRKQERTREPRLPGSGGPGGGDRDGGEGRGSLEGSDESGDRARLGLALALTAMSTLFLAFLIAYLLLRKNAPTWPPPGAPLPPRGLWISTLVLLASSASLVVAHRAGRAGEVVRLRRWLALTLELGTGFLLVQGFLWREVLTSGRFTFSDAYGTIFYSLTGLHAAHVIGGLLLLLRTRKRVRRDPFGARTRLALDLASTYWHFMGAVWMVLFVVLEFLN